MAKKNYVENLFNNIASSYDRLNHILSLNIDKCWRKKAVKIILSRPHELVLDVACGTGDFAIALAKAGVKEVVGIDISEKMLEIGKKKIAQRNFEKTILLQYEDCEKMNFETNSFDGVTVAFGVRNFEHLNVGIQEMYRVLKPGGKLVILELSTPENKLIFSLYNIYFKHILPSIGGWISGDKSAYRYLYQSVLQFPKPDKFIPILSSCGFQKVEHKAFTFGLARMYVATK